MYGDTHNTSQEGHEALNQQHSAQPTPTGNVTTGDNDPNYEGSGFHSPISNEYFAMNNSQHEFSYDQSQFTYNESFPVNNGYQMRPIKTDNKRDPLLTNPTGMYSPRTLSRHEGANSASAGQDAPVHSANSENRAASDYEDHEGCPKSCQSWVSDPPSLHVSEPSPYAQQSTDGFIRTSALDALHEWAPKTSSPPFGVTIGEDLGDNPVVKSTHLNNLGSPFTMRDPNALKWKDLTAAERYSRMIGDQNNQFAQHLKAMHGVDLSGATITRPVQFTTQVATDPLITSTGLCVSGNNPSNQWSQSIRTRYYNPDAPIPEVHPETDPSIQTVIGQAEILVTQLYDAMNNLDDVWDNEGSKDRKLFEGTAVKDEVRRATCDLIMLALVHRCIMGYTGPDRKDESKKEDKALNCFQRFTRIVRTLKFAKTACRDVLFEDNKIALLVNQPIAVEKTKIALRKTNNNRKLANEALKAQNAAATIDQAQQAPAAHLSAEDSESSYNDSQQFVAPLTQLPQDANARNSTGPKKRGHKPRPSTTNNTLRGPQPSEPSTSTPQTNKRKRQLLDEYEESAHQASPETDTQANMRGRPGLHVPIEGYDADQLVTTDHGLTISNAGTDVVRNPGIGDIKSPIIPPGYQFQGLNNTTPGELLPRATNLNMEDYLPAKKLKMRIEQPSESDDYTAAVINSHQSTTFDFFSAMSYAKGSEHYQESSFDVPPFATVPIQEETQLSAPFDNSNLHNTFASDFQPFHNFVTPQYTPVVPQVDVTTTGALYDPVPDQTTQDQLDELRLRYEIEHYLAGVKTSVPDDEALFEATEDNNFDEV